MECGARDTLTTGSAKEATYDSHICGRRHRRQSLYLFLVAMRETPGLHRDSILPFTADEAKMLSDLYPLLQLKLVTSPCNKNDVLRDSRRCTVFHFAGHGQTDFLEPLHSSLLLKDWEANPLTAGDLLNQKIQENPPFLGYLSACSQLDRCYPGG
jgi:CHAT domain-containing protein